MKTRRKRAGKQGKNHEAKQQYKHTANKKQREREEDREKHGKRIRRKHKRNRTTVAHPTTVTAGLQVRTKRDW
jgi:hypothetical protein